MMDTATSISFRSLQEAVEKANRQIQDETYSSSLLSPTRASACSASDGGAGTSISSEFDHLGTTTRNLIANLNIQLLRERLDFGGASSISGSESWQDVRETRSGIKDFTNTNSASSDPSSAYMAAPFDASHLSSSNISNGGKLSSESNFGDHEGSSKNDVITKASDLGSPFHTKEPSFKKEEGRHSVQGSISSWSHYCPPSPELVAEKPNQQRTYSLKSSDSYVPIEEARDESVENGEEEEGMYVVEAAQRHVSESQEVDGLHAPMTRSQSDFSRWLEDTLLHARGDGSSSCKSEPNRLDASSSLEAKRATLGKQGFTPALCCPHDGHYHHHTLECAARELHQNLSSEAFSSLLHETSVSSGDDLDEQHVKKGTSGPERIIPIKECTSSATQHDPGSFIKTPSMQEASRISEKPDCESTRSDPFCSSPPSSSKWRNTSFVLALALAINILRSHNRSWPSILADNQRSVFLHQTLIPLQNNTSTRIEDFLVAKPYLPIGSRLTELSILVYGVFLLLPVAASITFFLLSCYKIKKESFHPISKAALPPVTFELNATSVLALRKWCSEGENYYYQRDLNRAMSCFDRAIKEIGCSPGDKALAYEWRGRTQYRLARASRDLVMMREAAISFCQSVRLGGGATSKASWGRALFCLGEFQPAIKPLASAIRRDPMLAYGYEYLGKVYARLNQWEKAQVHLKKAIAIGSSPLKNPSGHPSSSSSSSSSNYKVLAFLGDQLHAAGQSADAIKYLQRAVNLRMDYPAAHMRLAFIHMEELKMEQAVVHIKLAIAYRQSGFHDPDGLFEACEATLGVAPYLSLYFATPRESVKSRTQVLEQARMAYPYEPLLIVLEGMQELRLCSSGGGSGGRSHRQGRLAALATGQLTRLRTAFDSESRCLLPRWNCDDEKVVEEDEEQEVRLKSLGLSALCSLGLGEHKLAESQFREFWKRAEQLNGDKKTGGWSGKKMDRTLAFIVTAFRTGAC